jgi:hypothetical protein
LKQLRAQRHDEIQKIIREEKKKRRGPVGGQVKPGQIETIAVQQIALPTNA